MNTATFWLNIIYRLIECILNAYAFIYYGVAYLISFLSYVVHIFFLLNLLIWYARSVFFSELPIADRFVVFVHFFSIFVSIPFDSALFLFILYVHDQI